MSKKVVGSDYFELVRRFPLRPIRSEKQLEGATAVIDELVAREKRSTDADDYLDVLSDLVEKYEAEYHPIPDATPSEILSFLIDDRKTNQRAVAFGAGIAVSTMSEILAGRRQLNLEHMRKLAAFFGVDIRVFLPKDKPAVVKARKAAAQKRKK